MGDISWSIQHFHLDFTHTPEGHGPVICKVGFTRVDIDSARPNLIQFFIGLTQVRIAYRRIFFLIFCNFVFPELEFRPPLWRYGIWHTDIHKYVCISTGTYIVYGVCSSSFKTFFMQYKMYSIMTLNWLYDFRRCLYWHWHGISCNIYSWFWFNMRIGQHVFGQSILSQLGSFKAMVNNS